MKESSKRATERVTNPQCNLQPGAQEVVEMIDVVGASLVEKLSVRQRVEHVEILSRRRIDVRIEVVMTQKLVLVMESSDELRACVSHAVSMAENGAKVKRWWTVW